LRNWLTDWFFKWICNWYSNLCRNRSRNWNRNCLNAHALWHSNFRLIIFIGLRTCNHRKRSVLIGYPLGSTRRIRDNERFFFQWHAREAPIDFIQVMARLQPKMRWHCDGACGKFNRRRIRFSQLSGKFPLSFFAPRLRTRNHHITHQIPKNF